MSVSIVVPCFNHWELCHSLLFDLYQYCRSAEEVLVVDDGSTDLDFIKGLQWWQEQHLLPLRIMELEENIGFLKACNAGVRKAKGDIVILISNDVHVKDDIVSIVANKLNYEPKTIIGNRLIEFDTGWNTFGGRIFPYLEGWLLAFTKSAWNELKGFDEIYSPYDCEDLDFSTNAIDKGYTLFSIDNSKVTHMGAQSIGFNPQREAITIRNKEKFRKKWMIK